MKPHHQTVTNFYRGRGLAWMNLRRCVRWSPLLILIILGLAIWYTYRRLDSIYQSGADLTWREIPFSKFSYPLDLPHEEFVEAVRSYRECSLRSSSSVKCPVVPPFVTIFPSVRFKNSLKHEGPYALIILIKSAPSHSGQREGIRRTWGRQKSLQNGNKIFLAFFIGDSGNPTVDEAVALEASSTQDIVLLDYKDSYYNNTIKSVLEMRYAVEMIGVSSFRHALLIDDDYYLDPEAMVALAPKLMEPDPRLYIGHAYFWFSKTPARERRIGNRWFLSLETYPYTRFPSYVAGSILLSADAVSDLYWATFFTAPFPIDDVFLGILAQKMGIRARNSDLFQHSSRPLPSRNNGSAISVGDIHSGELVKLWETLHPEEKKINISKI